MITAMQLLNDLKKIKRLDKQNMNASIEALWQQCEQVYDEIKKIKFPKSYFKNESILVNGMGGSALGSHIIQSLYKDELKIPFRFINSYSLPAYVKDKKDLIIISSFSGNTEEALQALREAQKRKMKIIGIAGGGRLGSMIKSGKVHGYVFEPKYNPCREPRMGVGYSVFSQFLILKKLGYLKIGDKELKEVINFLGGAVDLFGINKPSGSNPAKLMAKKLYDKIPIVVASEFLEGSAHVMRNQFNETAKSFASYFLIPEMNHHLMEGLQFPGQHKKHLVFLFFESGFYNKRNQKRYEVTQSVLEKNKVAYLTCPLQSKSKLLQVFEMMIFGSYVSFYLGLLNGVNPTPTPYVKYFKKRMK